MPSGPKPVLFITHSDDSHADRVQAALLDQGVPVARINTDEWPPSWSLSVGFRREIPTTAELFVNDMGWIGLENVRSIWFRRVVDPSFPALLSSDDRRLLLSERHEAIDALLGLFRGFIVGNPFDYRRVDNKVVQLALARAHGLEVPDTLLTSFPAHAKLFLDSYSSAVYKLQRSVYLDRDGALFTVYTSKVDAGARQRLALVAMSPSLFQEEVSKAFELRVTVVGEHCFACRMDTQASPLTRVDYRKYDFDNVAHEPFSLPEALRERCVAMLRSVPLFFASMDFICTPDNRYVFLDLNPNGQWLWTQELAGLPIAASMAALLASPPNS